MAFDSEDPDSCCVCGSTATLLRCSACAAVGVNLFFCGKEHQKWVWKAHKPICGQTCVDFASFRFPDLTTHELDTFRKVGRIDFPVEMLLLYDAGQVRAKLGNGEVRFSAVFDTLAKVDKGSYEQLSYRLNEWLHELAPVRRTEMHLLIRSGLLWWTTPYGQSELHPRDLPELYYTSQLIYGLHRTSHPVLPDVAALLIHRANIWFVLARRAVKDFSDLSRPIDPLKKQLEEYMERLLLPLLTYLDRNDQFLQSGYSKILDCAKPEQDLGVRVMYALESNKPARMRIITPDESTGSGCSPM
ncbi:hypothetical protein JCM10908_004778 [Rhodotorula pacifica]|uniref:zinc finger MYND domain-containing protein n=1 Tax=Rhodotorula pacifica TaxID=1495444 RepID=UPI0031702C67